jgi:hypothetical protein
MNSILHNIQMEPEPRLPEQGPLLMSHTFLHLVIAENTFLSRLYRVDSSFTKNPA